MVATEQEIEPPTVPQKGMRTEVFWMYFVQATSAIMPLFLIHHVSRIIGPMEWGRLALAEAIGRYLQVVVEYGFQVSGSRDAAIAKDRPQLLGTLVTNILSAQFVLAITCVPAAVLLGSKLGLGSASKPLLTSAIIWGIAQAMTLSWFYQATGQIRRFAIFDLCIRAISVTSICLLVSRPDQAWLVLAFQACGSTLTVVVTLIAISRRAPLIRPNFARVRQTIRQGFSLFSFRAAGMLYISLNVVLLSFFVSTAAVGMFAAAERICRFALYALTPLNTVFYVRIARLQEVNASAATDLAKKATEVLGLCGVAAGAFLGFCGPWVVSILFGPNFAAAGNLTRYFGVVVTFATLNSIIGAAWLLPRRKDRVLSIGSIAAGVVNVALASLLARRFGGTGMVISLIVCELVIFAVYYQKLLGMGIQLLDLRQHRKDAGRYELVELEGSGIRNIEPSA